MFLVLVGFLLFTQASPIPDQRFDGNLDLCLSRRDVSSIFDYSETAPEDSLYTNSDLGPLHYEDFNLPLSSDLSNEGPEDDLDFLSYDFAALALDSAPNDSGGRRKGACSTDSNPLQSSFGGLSPIPANPYIPSCELDYPFTFCCRGIPIPVPRKATNLGSEVLALPDLDDSDDLVNVGECINCE